VYILLLAARALLYDLRLRSRTGRGHKRGQVVGSGPVSWRGVDDDSSEFQTRLDRGGKVSLRQHTPPVDVH